MSAPAVPFDAEWTTGPLGMTVMSAHGIVRLERLGLAIEFTQRQMKMDGSEDLLVLDELSGTMRKAAPAEKATVQTIHIPLETLSDVRITGGLLLAPRLHIEVNRVAALAGVPWADGACCVLKLRRRDRFRLRELALDLDMRQADAQLRELEGPPDAIEPT